MMRCLALYLLLVACTTAEPPPVVKAADPAPPQTQPQAKCGPARDVMHALAKRFHEQPVGIGDEEFSPGKVLLVGPRSWTLIEIDHAGIACLIATGDMLDADGKDA